MSREAHAPGAPSAPGAIPLAVPDIGDAETAAILEALDSGFVSSVGPAVDAFERNFSERVGARYAIACSSGTAALHVAMRLAGVGPGDEVFCSGFTFIGSANPIAYQAARPTFVDSELRTWNLNPAVVVEELQKRARTGAALPKAVEVVHVLGQPADIAPIIETCARYEIPVIEDAAESLGAGWSAGQFAGCATGTVADIGCFSFNGNKIATAGGGGMIVTDDSDLAARARHLTTQAKLPDVGYLHDEIGYNYRLTNLAAALGNAQLQRLDEFVAAKRRIAATYDAQLQDLPLELPPRLLGFDSTYWLYSVLTEDLATRDRLLAFLAEARIGARALWRPLHQQPPFSGAANLGTAVADELFERGVSLPCSTSLSDADQARVVEAMRTFFDTEN